MSKKYVIDLPDDVQYILINGASENHCYTRVEQVDDLEELNSDYINEHFGELQDEAYKQGYADAERIWRAPSSDNEFYQKGLEDGKKSTENGCDGCEHENQKEGASPCCECARVCDDHYIPKHSDRIEVGDIVDVYGNLGVVTYMYELKACVMMVEDGASGDWDLNELKKTGKHYDIASILEAMRK